MTKTVDYYETGIPGCCLDCPNAAPGCLCYDCKCTKCDAYHGGTCDWPEYFRKERELVWKEENIDVKTCRGCKKDYEVSKWKIIDVLCPFCGEDEEWDGEEEFE